MHKNQFRVRFLQSGTKHHHRTQLEAENAAERYRRKHFAGVRHNTIR